MRVLIVDDERPARDKLHHLLTQEADITSIVEARDGVEALELIAAQAPDVVFWISKCRKSAVSRWQLHYQRLRH